MNGLQTSREIFDYFLLDKPADEQRALLVRVIETSNAEMMDQIIRATNSQNRMQEASLRMTDPIHRQIEGLFRQYDLSYDRRKGFYKDKASQFIKSLAQLLSRKPLLLSYCNDQTTHEHAQEIILRTMTDTNLSLESKCRFPFIFLVYGRFVAFRNI